MQGKDLSCNEAGYKASVGHEVETVRLGPVLAVPFQQEFGRRYVFQDVVVGYLRFGIGSIRQ